MVLWYLVSTDSKFCRVQAALQLRQQGQLAMTPGFLQGHLLLKLLHLGLELLRATPCHLHLLPRLG